MAFAVIVRRHNGVQSYLILDDNPREMLRHVGFVKEFSIRSWRGSLESDDAREEWAEMLGEDPFDGTYGIIDSTNWEFKADAPLWAECIQDKE
ncbi:MAG: hypothetical protein FJ134_17125 [Deltaproteobacteria bacterium]|nr:hypothetical protein [Deltaproteobacteria bacterium]